MHLAIKMVLDEIENEKIKYSKQQIAKQITPKGNNPTETMNYIN